MKIGDKGQRGSQAEKTNVDPAVDLAKEKLGEVLVSNDMLTAEQLQTALDIARREGKVVGQVLIEKGWLTSHDLTTALSIQMGIPLVDLKRHKIRP
ncbi:MAG: hypothetical protein FJZ93_06790, partial [Chloroflexi bacterium]|nr:hypothetical protein [Chloroflexota bacterium]